MNEVVKYPKHKIHKHYEIRDNFGALYGTHIKIDKAREIKERTIERYPSLKITMLKVTRITEVIK